MINSSFPNNPPLLALQNISWSYQPQQPLFRHFSLRIRAREHYSIIGTSGSGKTTLLHLCSALLTPSSGHVYFQGAPLYKPHPRISVVFQHYGLFPWKTVEENIFLPLRLHNAAGLPPADPDLPARLELEDIRSHYPHQLSGGQQQRVALARSLISHPRLLLLDEPFSALDEYTGALCRREIHRYLQQTDATLLLVTHNLTDARSFGTNILVLSHKKGGVPRVVPHSTPASVLRTFLEP